MMNRNQYNVYLNIVFIISLTYTTTHNVVHISAKNIFNNQAKVLYTKYNELY